ncbi:MAG: protein-glutamate O-methyltransferase [Gemmatimonadaceae bacterium]|nr:protein-glutamate O-methyltransferase [Gemmatimonadaceae bacterium]
MSTIGTPDTLPSEPLLTAPDLTPDDFRRVRQIAYERAGLAIPAGKEGLVRSRVSKRLRDGQVATFRAYLDGVEANPNGEEMVRLIDLLTTNKTDFFREPAHFDFLRNQVLPGVVASGRPLRIWSAGCSTGEEPYTLAMVLRESLPARHDFRILATDICTRVVAAARAGTFSAQQLSDVSRERRARWFTATPDGGGTVGPELRTPISFAHLNLMAPWPMSGPFDAIFCRNVMIYFDKPTVTRLVGRFHELLAPGGHLFIGHSESLTAVEHRYRYVQPAVYAK